MSSSNFSLSKQQLQKKVTTSSPSKRYDNDTAIVRIISATYGPSHGRRLAHGEVVPPSESARIPYTRDVLPFVRALLIAQQRQRQQYPNDDGREVDWQDYEEDYDASADGDTKGYNEAPNSYARQYKRRKVIHEIPLMDGKSMNMVFGDPCPGTTKRLDITTIDHGKIYRVSFAEHERVVLKRKALYFGERGLLHAAAQAVKQTQHEEAEELSTGQAKLSAGAELSSSLSETVSSSVALHLSRLRSQSTAELADSTATSLKQSQTLLETATGAASGTCDQGMRQNYHQEYSESKNASSTPQSSTLELTCSQFASSDTNNASSSGDNTPATTVNDEAVHFFSPTTKWRLGCGTSEIVLPVILPYLTLQQRVHCQQVCKTWKNVISEQGVAQHIDVNDPSSYAFKARYTNRILKGIISNSYPSLQRLFLNNYAELTPQDFHPAIPYLRKLTHLDVSRCIQLTDETLLLIAQHLKDTLEVLYMKGLRNTSDAGLTAISQSCRKLRVLEISNVPITDASGIAIGRNLHKLEALYMRDNFLLTNASVNVIMSLCSKLTQLTLWGCTRITTVQSDFRGVDDKAVSNDASTVAPNDCNEDSYNHHLVNGSRSYDVDTNNASSLTATGISGPQNLILLNLWGW